MMSNTSNTSESSKTVISLAKSQFNHDNLEIIQKLTHQALRKKIISCITTMGNSIENKPSNIQRLPRKDKRDFDARFVRLIVLVDQLNSCEVGLEELFDYEDVNCKAIITNEKDGEN